MKYLQVRKDKDDLFDKSFGELKGQAWVQLSMRARVQLELHLSWLLSKQVCEQFNRLWRKLYFQL